MDKKKCSNEKEKKKKRGAKLLKGEISDWISNGGSETAKERGSNEAKRTEAR